MLTLLPDPACTATMAAHDQAPSFSQAMHPPKVKVSSGAAVKDMQFCDDETAFWQMASQHSQLHHAYSGSCHPHLGDCCSLKFISIAGVAPRVEHDRGLHVSQLLCNI